MEFRNLSHCTLSTSPYPKTHSSKQLYLRIIRCLSHGTTQSPFGNSPKQNPLGENRVPSMFITRESDQKPISNHYEASSTNPTDRSRAKIPDARRTLYEDSTVSFGYSNQLSHVPSIFHDRETTPKFESDPESSLNDAPGAAEKTVRVASLSQVPVAEIGKKVLGHVRLSLSLSAAVTRWLDPKKRHGRAGNNDVKARTRLLATLGHT